MNAYGFSAGVVNGVMGGLLGLCGATVRAPGLAAPRSHTAAVLHIFAACLVVVAAWMCRAKSVPLEQLADHLDVVLSLLAGGLAGIWWRFQPQPGWRAVLAGVALLAVAQALHGATGVLAGVLIGMVMGCNAGIGLLLVPAIVLLYGLDIKVAGSLALMISLPMLLAGLVRVPIRETLAIVRAERQFPAQGYGVITGAAIGTLLLDLLPSRILMAMLEALLVYAAFVNFGALFTKFLHNKS
jgi:hypothetical protein